MLKNKLIVASVVLGVVLLAFLALNQEEEPTKLPEPEITVSDVFVQPETSNTDGVFVPHEPPRTWEGEVEKTLKAQASFLETIAAASVSQATKQKVLDDRQTLMGILINNNFAAIRDGHEEDIVFLNGDWTIDKIPQRLTLTDKDREFLDKFIKAEND